MGVGDPRSEAATLRMSVPNPMRRAGAVHFELPQASRITLEVFDPLGRRVRSLLDGATLAPGRHQVRFDVAGLRAGIYYALLDSDAGRASRTFALLP